ncbi:MAG: sulfurtransferase [Acidimicrobiia bacterium]|nr:sulfurtransferase [Acidimicrobiia bacterium]
MDDRNPFSGPLVEVDWLVRHHQEVVLADVRWSVADGPKRDEFEHDHIPGAIFVDLDRDLSDPPGDRGRHPLPPVPTFRQTLHRLGLAGRPVVCYDDASGAVAARLWWMLRTLDLPAAVLNGGVEAWPGPWESGPSRPPPAAEATPEADHGEDWPDHNVVTVDQVLSELQSGRILLDARSTDRFEGRPNPIDSPAGHIPGARSRPWTANIGDDGRLLSAVELRRQFGQHGVKDSSIWMASCGSGVTACHNLLAADVAGLPGGRLYDGSWSEWIRDPTRPVISEHSG